MKPLRIAVMVDRITPGATPKIIGSEVKHLRELGHDAEAVSIMDTGLPKGDHQFDEYLSGIPIRYMSQEHPFLRRFDFPIPPFSFFAAFDVVAGYSMSRFLKRDRQRYDVIIAHTSITCWVANKVWRSTGIPYVAVMWDTISFIMDDVYHNRPHLRPFLPLAVRLAKGMDRRLIDGALVAVTGSKPHFELVKRFAGREVEVLYPGVDVAETIPEQRGDYLFTIDRWDVGNMPNWLLDVLAGLSRPAKLKVAGYWWPAKMQDVFLAAVKEHGLEDVVEVLGPVSEADLRGLLRGARAMIYPHMAGIVFGVMEAAGEGCPVMMQESIDLFTHGIDGFFPSAGDRQRQRCKSTRFDTHRPEDLTEFIDCTQRLLNDERLAWEMGRNAWELMKQYSWRARAQRLLDLIEQHLPEQR